MSDTPLFTPQHRAMLWAAMLAKGAAPTSSEQQLLTAYARGLAAQGESVQHVLYCRQATQPLNEPQLMALLEQARANNERQQLTGLLCYEAGHFVQVLEGPPAAVSQVFARIERDPRHWQVQVLSAGQGPLRQFADWRLVFAGTHPTEFYWLTTYLEARRHQLVLPQVPVPEPELVALLETFSHACDEQPPPSPTPGMLGALHPAAPPPEGGSRGASPSLNQAPTKHE